MNEETTALAVVEQEAEQALAALLAQNSGALLPAGIDRLEPGDTGMPPRLRISQPNRPIKIGDDTVEAGLIVNTLTGQTWTALDIVVLVFLDKTRVMWPTAFSADNDPVCLSNDGKRPAEASDMRKMTQPQAGPCATCPSAKFGENNKAPACKMQRNFLVWMVEEGEPAILTMQSTALEPARNLTTLSRTKGFKASITFVTRLVDDTRGSWVVPAFTTDAKENKLKASEQIAIHNACAELANLVVGADVEVAQDEGEAFTEPSTEPKEEIPF